jgi:hypothetical protein
MAHAASDVFASRESAEKWRAAAEVALIFLVFFIDGAWPAPDVNEPHYLGKAKHYWDTSWCPRDFFLGTADAHAAFYFAFGWLTRWLPLEAVAWCGRVLTWGLLAWSWRRLSVAVVDGWLYSVLSAALFVALNERFHMAGEWVVGGVEAKGFAYVLVFLGLGSLVRDRWGWALVLFGGAAAFHVVVGGWAVVAAGVTWLAADNRPPLARLVLPAALGFVLALGGLLPAVALTWGADPDVVREANRIYVYERLPHHLSPAQLPWQYVARHLLLVGSLVPLVRLAPSSAAIGRLRSFVAAAVGIAAVGMAISLSAWWSPDFAAGLLRYYWFRMSDVMVPLGVALLAAAVLCRWQSVRHPLFALGLAAALLATGWHLGERTWFRQQYLRPPADWDVAELADYQAVCRWVAEETEPDALFIVPRFSQSFRWHTGRAEVVTRKDLPQDAAAIVEWWRRLTQVYGRNDTQLPWYDSPAELGAARLKELGREFGADYVLSRAEPPLPLPRVGPLRGGWAVYELPRAAAAAPGESENRP